MPGDLLAIAPAMVINEYGMTELCSQLYDATSFNCPGVVECAERYKIAPPWLRVTARDPVTLRPMADGEIGMLTFFDLANVGSVSAVMTEDLGYVERGRVRVLGRAARRGARLRAGNRAILGDRSGGDFAMSATSSSSAMRMPRAENVGPGADRMADALARAFALWRDRNYARRRDAITAIADAAGYSIAMLENSIDALLKPFTRRRLEGDGSADFRRY